MSRIGKLPIKLPAGVVLSRNKELVTLKGPKGTLHQQVLEAFQFEENGGEFSLKRPSDTKENKSLHGLYRSLINNMAIGVGVGYERILELVGVGYRADAKGQVLELALGFSHQVFFVIPPEVKVATEQQKGQNPKIILSAIDKQLLGQVAAKIRAIRPPEPYKGKGVRYANEIVRRKAGKSGGKGKK